MQITPRIHALTIPFIVPTPAGPLHRSVSVFLHCGAKITLIDSGVAGSEEPIYRYLEEIGSKPERIEQLILTHSHPDHVGAAQEIQRRSGCRVLAHVAEQSWIEDVNRQEQERPVPGFQTLVGGSVAVDQLLYGDEFIQVDDESALEVIPTPGHSAGSISLWSPAERVLFTGDAVLVPGDMPIFDDYAAAVASLKKIMTIEPEWLLSAWDGPRHAADARILCEASLEWLQRIYGTVQGVAKVSGSEDPMELCRQVVAELGLPPFAVNPLVARSFLSCLEIR